MKNIFNIGDIVALKSHPLFNKNYLKISCPASQVPPLMLVKEILIEDEKKRVFSDEIKDTQIADRIKYICVYFNNNKSEFIEKIIYQSFLKSHQELNFFRKEDDAKANNNDTLVNEVSKYISPKYVFGDIVNFKTIKLESKKTFEDPEYKYTHIYTTPNFLLSGKKINDSKKMYHNDGKPKKIVSKTLFKILWYNHFQQKNSEIYLPKEFFIESSQLRTLTVKKLTSEAALKKQSKN